MELLDEFYRDHSIDCRAREINIIWKIDNINNTKAFDMSVKDKIRSLNVSPSNIIFGERRGIQFFQYFTDSNKLRVEKRSGEYIVTLLSGLRIGKILIVEEKLQIEG